MDSNARMAALLGGYGSGKTLAGAHKALDLACLNERLDGLIVAPTWGLLHKITLRTFYDEEAPDEGVLPHEWVAEHRKGKRYIKLKNGARIYYGSADRPKTLEGSNLAWFWVDEARFIGRPSWNTLAGRLRHKASVKLQGVVTSTPAPGWLQKEFGGENKDNVTFHCSTYENQHNLAPDVIERLERQYGRRLARSLIHGRFGAAEYAVYGDFDMEQVHGIKWDYKPGLRTVGIVDFGRRRPAVLFVQRPHAGKKLAPGRWAEDSSWVAFDQIVEDNLNIWKLGELIVEKCRANGYEIEEWYCDPAGNSVGSQGISDVHVLRELGRKSAQEGLKTGLENISWCSDPMLTYIPNGVSLVEGLLKNTRDETRLYVARSMAGAGPRGLVDAFDGYHYPEPKDGKPVSEQPVKDGVTDHIMDCGRYLAVNEAMRGNLEFGSIATR